MNNNDALMSEIKKRGYADIDSFIKDNWDLLTENKKKILEILGFNIKQEGGVALQIKK